MYLEKQSTTNKYSRSSHFKKSTATIYVLIPGHHTDSLALSRHLAIPKCPWCILSNTSNLMVDRMSIVLPFNIRPLTTEMSPRSLPYGLRRSGTDYLSGLPSSQYCCIFLHTSSCCISASETNELSCKTLRALIESRFSCLNKASLMYISIPGIWTFLRLSLIYLILSLSMCGKSFSNMCVVNNGTKGFVVCFTCDGLPQCNH